MKQPRKDQYGFEQGNIPASYEKISWQDKLERIPQDYGLIEPANPGREFTNWEESPEHDLAEVF